MKEMQPDEFAAGEADSSGGATGIFGVVKTPAASRPEVKAAKDEAAVPASSPPEEQTSTIKMREVVFKATDHATFEDTDALRRILNPSQAATVVPVALAADDSGAGGFTQLLRAMSPHVATPAGAKPVAVAAPSIPVDTSVGAVKDHPVAEPVRVDAASAPLPPPHAPEMPQTGPVAGTRGEESFTQMFAVPAASAVSAVPRVPTVRVPSAIPVANPAPAMEAPSQNVGFTQLFQSFKGQTPPPVLPVVAAPPGAPPAVPVVASGLSDVPVQGSAAFAPKEEHAKPAAGAVFSQPVSIPELSREILHEGNPSVSTPSAEAQGNGGFASAPEVRPQPVGSFTQLFQTLAKPGRPVVPEPVKAPVASSSGDSGSFTQLFSTLGSRPPAQTTQADSFPPLNPSSSPTQGGFGAPPPNEAYPAPSYREPVYREPRPSEPVFSTPPPPASSPTAEGGGEMTRLLRRLDSASHGQATPPPLKTEPLPVASAAPVFSQPASLAQGATVAFRIPETSAASFRPAPPEPPVNTGAGGMTSILNASALRESIRRGGGGEASAGAPSAAPPVAPPAAGGGGFPAMPGYPAMPSMPSMAAPSMQMPPAQPQPTPQPHMQMPAMPQMQAPPMPQVQMPKADGAAPAGGGKSWVPILLMVIIVLLVGILLAVVLLMKK